MELIRDCLDKQVTDRKGHKMGRVDGIIIDLSGGGRPVVSAIELGTVCQANRLATRLGKIAQSISRRAGVVNHDPFRIPWSKVVSAGTEVIVGVEAEKTEALAWELWLRKNIIERIPGGA